MTNTTELVERLRHLSKLLGVGSYDIPGVLREAADAIEQERGTITGLREAGQFALILFDAYARRTNGKIEFIRKEDAEAYEIARSLLRR